MPRERPSAAQDFLSSVIVPCLSLALILWSVAAVIVCVLHDRLRTVDERSQRETTKKGCVIITGGRMAKALTLARAFKRAGWKVIGVEERGWGEFCPLRFSSSISNFYILPPASTSYSYYSSRLLDIAKVHSADLFIPVSGAGSSVEDARAADEMYAATGGKCRTIIQDPETMLDLHDKDRFIRLVERLGMTVPRGKMVTSVEEAMDFLNGSKEPTYVLKCMGLDENRGDMTLYPLEGDAGDHPRTKRQLEGLRMGISKDCPYVFQEFIPGQEWCTHASVINGHLTSFVACPSNDMLMTYENATSEAVGKMAESWTRNLLDALRDDPTASGKKRTLTGHFSFDLIQHAKNGQLYPIECNARVHTAVILLPLDRIASCYDLEPSGKVLRPALDALPRSWVYNNIIMRLLPMIAPIALLESLHPSLPAAAVRKPGARPNEGAWSIAVEPTLVADDWLPFLVLWHVWWPALLLTRWWKGITWTRLNVSTGRIFEA